MRPTDQVRCRAAARRIRAGDRGRASLCCRATDSRARERYRASVGRPAARRVRDDANARAGRQGSEGRRRRRAQKNAEAVRPLQQDADASSEDARRVDVLVVQIGRQAQFGECVIKSMRALLETARRLRAVLFKKVPARGLADPQTHLCRDALVPRAAPFPWKGPAGIC